MIACEGISFAVFSLSGVDLERTNSRRAASGPIADRLDTDMHLLLHVSLFALCIILLHLF